MCAWASDHRAAPQQISYPPWGGRKDSRLPIPAFNLNIDVAAAAKTLRSRQWDSNSPRPSTSSFPYNIPAVSLEAVQDACEDLGFIEFVVGCREAASGNGVTHCHVVGTMVDFEANKPRLER